MLSDGLKGAVLGLSIAAPVGPIGLLCIRRSLSQGAWAGIAGGLGTAAADAVYATVAAFGFAAVSAQALLAARPLRWVAIAALVYLGASTFRARPAETPVDAGHGTLFAQTFFLTLANPATILSFAAMAAGLGLDSDPARAAALVAGVFAGSLAWWIAASLVVARIRTRVTAAGLRWINYLSGAALIGFAAALAAGL